MPAGISQCSSEVDCLLDSVPVCLITGVAVLSDPFRHFVIDDRAGGEERARTIHSLRQFLCIRAFAV